MVKDCRLVSVSYKILDTGILGELSQMDDQSLKEDQLRIVSTDKLCQFFWGHTGIA